jgi:branched-chain amino acid transport system substrate-binding protein
MAALLGVDVKAVVDKFMAQGYGPEGDTLYTYAAVQVFAEAANKVDDLSKALKSTTVDAVVGPLSWNKKGDVTDPRYVFYI